MSYADILEMDTPAGMAGEARHLVSYAPLVKRIARQLSSQAGAVLDREDMEQIGLMALLECLRRYGEPDERFGGFAALRIRGAILDELRRLDWRPRTVRQDAHRVRDALRELMRRLGREPSDAEAMAALGMDAEAWQAYQLADNAESMASFDVLVDEYGGLGAQTTEGPEAALIARRSLEQAVMVLDEREQLVIQLYYEYELSLKEIALVLELTEARICQINRKALEKMKVFLQADIPRGRDKCSR
ncbi:FliA/WhiG family RNA polymerase sigma factor [Paludibacterium paludis]|uniref:DNA-directed RNA polymerase sigma-70 factor n=1 Tax=Paludibacterium paludis TaxID=1225769 RepID=A0A918NXL4_9NEIS|nr:FliA/WhiG family RNA polymerase sigma factor [Paludibacterium paludis]GGY04662.1 DNA-directed RNA polymerase sigma-70 factor [Paludibacterium paludis]